MKARLGLLMIGAMLGLPGSVGLAAAAPPAIAPAPAFQRVADGDSGTARDSYLHQAQDTLEAWRRKLNASADDAGAHARSTGDAAHAELNAAWQKTQVEAKRLATAGADQWDKARSSFENATRALKDSWNRAHSDDQ